MERIRKRACALVALATMAFMAAAPAQEQKADALLSIDLNRTTVIDRIVGDWGAALAQSSAGISSEQLRTMLSLLRADHLLAASLAGSLPGLRDVLATAAAGSAPTAISRVAGKALGDANQDLVYTPQSPCRLFDTRASQGGLGTPSLNVRRTYGATTPVASQGGPGGCAAGAGAVVALIQLGTLTPSGSGVLQGGPQGVASFPNALVLYQTGDQYGTAVAMPLNVANGQFDLLELFATADLYGDLLGFFKPASGGFVSSVVAGAGLTGGTITGSGTIGLAATQLLPTVACNNAQVPQWNGSAWVCASVGTVTSVATGQGLQGGPIAGSGTVDLRLNAGGGLSKTLGAGNELGIAAGGVTSAMLASGAVTGAKIGAGLPGSRPQQNSNFFRIDVSGTGMFNSMVIGADGLPIIAYYDQTLHVLKVAHCEAVDCATSTISTIDNNGDVGQNPSATILANGLPAISYYDVTNTALKVAFCTNIPCTSATLTTVDTNNDVGMYSSIVSSANGGFIALAYYDNTLKDLKIALCGGPTTCPSPTIYPAVQTGNVGEWAAATVTASGELAVAYYDATAHQVRLAYCQAYVGGGCNAPFLVTVESLVNDAAEGISLTINGLGNPVLAYRRRTVAGDGTTKIAVCDSEFCTTPVVTQLVGFNGTTPVFNVGLTVAPDGLPVVFAPSFALNSSCPTANSSNFAYFVKCRNVACTTYTLNAGPGINGSASMTTGSDGNPVATFWNCGSGGLGGLGFSHCTNSSCIPFARPR